MYKKIIHGGAWVLLGQVGTALSQVLISIVLARLLSQTDYGVFQVLQRIVMFGALLASFGMSWGILKGVADAIANSRYYVALQQVKSTTLIVLIAALLVDLLYIFIGRELSDEYLKINTSTYTNVVLILIYSSAMQQVLSEGFRGLHNLKMASIFGGPAVNILFLLGVGVLYLNASADLTSLMWLMTIVTSVISCISLFLIISAISSKYTNPTENNNDFANITRRNFLDGISYTGTNIVNFIVTQADIWIVAFYFSTNEAAYYAAASRLGFLMSAPAMLANGIIRPSIVSLWGTGNSKKLQLILRSIATGSVLLAIFPLTLIAVYSSELMFLFFGNSYIEGGSVLFVISLGWFSLLLIGPAGTVMMLVGKQKQYFLCTTVSAIIFFVAAVKLAPIYGVLGVAFATAFGMAANSILASAYVWLRLDIKTFTLVSPVDILRQLAFLLAKKRRD